MTRKKMGGLSLNGMFYPIVGFASCMALIYLTFGGVKIGKIGYDEGPKMEFVERNGSHFVVEGKPFYVNGWNSYWLMDHAVDDYGRSRVGAMMRTGSKMGLTVCRTWAFNDGTYNALQISPGVFNDRVFQVCPSIVYCFSLDLSLCAHVRGFYVQSIRKFTCRCR